MSGNLSASWASPERSPAVRVVCQACQDVKYRKYHLDREGGYGFCRHPCYGLMVRADLPKKLKDGKGR